jgi:hypothetical protein
MNTNPVSPTDEVAKIPADGLAAKSSATSSNPM